MALWWNSLSITQQVMFVIACATTLFMLGQILMMLIGVGDSDGGADVELEVDTDASEISGGLDDGNGFSFFGLKILTVRSIIAFFCIGGWVAFTVEYFVHWALALVIGAAFGFGAAVLMAYLMNQIMKLQNSGNIEVANSVGAVGEVYLPIPANREGEGKVSVTIQERFVQLDAVTDSNESLATGTAIKIVSTVNDNVVVVEPDGDITRMGRNKAEKENNV